MIAGGFHEYVGVGRVVQKCHDTGKFVQVGHQRRYNPKYNLGMWMTYDRGMLGRITHITAQWHRNNQWRRPVPKDYVLNEEEKKYIPDFELHMNWRLFDEVSGGLYTELATHQTDIANWFLGQSPLREMARHPLVAISQETLDQIDRELGEI